MLEKYRVDHCELFATRQCQKHRPFNCFHWHYGNQRRRKPELRPDGSFSYSPDVYCSDYDEKSGRCKNGDQCKYLHRVSGDSERKYHPRYFKTAMCVHSTNEKGMCAKNGAYCAFAHSESDKRTPSLGFQDPGTCAKWAGPARKNSGSYPEEDEQWQTHEYVVISYKTELCQKPVSYCRQGYACPFYHNSKDRRRSPAVFKYRTTACPAAKPHNEWGDAENCAAGDDCQYCHSRTEQQFHPEVYKSTTCNDMLEYGFCPRGFFCAFCHHDSERYAMRDKYVEGTLEGAIRNGVTTPINLNNAQPMNIGTFETTEAVGPSSLTSPSLFWQSDSGGSEFPDMAALSLTDGGGEAFQPHIPDLNDPHQRCLLLEESLRNMTGCAAMWKARCEAAVMENKKMFEFFNSMGHQEPRPLSISIPEETGIRSLASLPHSPDFDIFAADPSNPDPPACMRCGRDPTSPIPDGPKKCPACCNNSV